MRQVHRCLKQCVLMAKVEAGQGRVELWKVGGGGPGLGPEDSGTLNQVILAAGGRWQGRCVQGPKSLFPLAGSLRAVVRDCSRARQH